MMLYSTPSLRWYLHDREMPARTHVSVRLRTPRSLDEPCCRPSECQPTKQSRTERNRTENRMMAMETVPFPLTIAAGNEQPGHQWSVQLYELGDSRPIRDNFLEPYQKVSMSHHLPVTCPRLETLSTENVAHFEDNHTE